MSTCASSPIGSTHICAASSPRLPRQNKKRQKKNSALFKLNTLNESGEQRLLLQERQPCNSHTEQRSSHSIIRHRRWNLVLGREAEGGIVIAASDFQAP